VSSVAKETEKAVDLCLTRRHGLSILESRLVLPRPLEIVFPFCADAANLETITPPWLRFEVLTPAPISMKVGALIEYRLACTASLCDGIGDHGLGSATPALQRGCLRWEP
jgi:hypothetical protein